MYTAETWPIAIKMNFEKPTQRGEGADKSPVPYWKECFQQIVDLGFTSYDPIDDWVELGNLSDECFSEFMELAQGMGLDCPSISIGRRSIVDVEEGEENLAFVHRTIDRAASLGANIVDIGFMQKLTPAQEKALWFWLEPGHVDDPKLRDLAVARVQELADHATEVGVDISLEMYEDTYIGTPEEAIAFVEDVNRSNVGLNPDLGNLIRLHRPMPRGEEMYSQVLPYSNYWHIKNYIRDEDPATGSYMSAPVPLKYGAINYRTVIREALSIGFKGPFQVEHYGSDWLGVGAENRDYIREVLASALK
ncbi:sugar phosphate isomerase/epimerase family protein [Actinobaculum suis]|uniref:sugar phosphate isomerase/epimerase family protein n=1 Tax=Actinobaculum suis TaxID=1657 RepID=UPI0008086AAB|nr:sugar phosphate isomerase/epimerase family protein [Actinobaculum suis]OCA93613.1 sugar phosphate isomerase [Actinobaculum suis]OCA93889.1 sugar phosphate isomerase [Actinobaculum suis]